MLVLFLLFITGRPSRIYLMPWDPCTQQSYLLELLTAPPFNLLCLLKDLSPTERELQGCTRLYHLHLLRFIFWFQFLLPSWINCCVVTVSWCICRLQYICAGCNRVPIRIYTMHDLLLNLLLHGFIWVDVFEIRLVHILHVFYHAILYLLWNDDYCCHTKSQCGRHHCCSILHAMESFQRLYDSSQGNRNDCFIVLCISHIRC